MLDPILPVRRKLIAALKGDAPLVAIVGARIYPAKEPDPVTWPFMRLDGASSSPFRADGGAGGEVTGLIHCFVKGGGSILDPEATCATINSHVVRIIEAMDAVALTGDTDLAVHARLSQVIPDPAEADAFHGVVRYEALAL
ncbi:tail completion protein gp17 [Sphingomonas sp. Root1294]|nr:DUF3168 domain-containing protein [Sphingomonas sp. Root1294]KQX18420.1 hypothetical protein ASD17_14760 [Sphingomonas sp. Root1294]KQY72255.1 hypothetical protein ASD39_20215 [Sphingomonas sp. Root50]KRB94474.1 hypothetical protein ASE22_00535 [Sphingomonas sp. Root720]